MNDEDSRSNDVPSPSRTKKRRSDNDKDPSVVEDDPLDIKRTAAKRRWGILSDHLTKKVRSADTNVITSTFNTYGLHELEQIGQDETGTWYRLKWKDKDWPIIEVRLIDKFRFDVMDLSGFNNTGNIRIWPAEECLAYYLLENTQLYEGKSVFEIGGGQSGLAGIFCGYLASEVVITDGNECSIENLQTILRHNKLESKCHAAFHRWNEPLPETIATKQFDLVIAADCFFDPNFHESFIDTLVSSLAPTGTALLFSPERGGSLRSFIEKLFQRNIFNVFDQKLIYHTYLTAEDLKEENEKYHDIQFDADAICRISGIVKAVLTEKWLPELNSFSDIKNRGAEDLDVELLFRNNPRFLRSIKQYAKEYEGESEEEDDNEGDEEEEENAEGDENEQYINEMEEIKISKSRPQTPALSKKKTSESPSNLITNYFEKDSRASSAASMLPPPSTPEPTPLVSTFASSKRQAADTNIYETPAKISKFNESITETQALNMIHTPIQQTPQISRINVSSIPAAPKPLVFSKVIQPVHPRPTFAQSNNQMAPKSTVAPAATVQKQQPLVKPLPPKQTEDDFFDDDDAFISILNNSSILDNEKNNALAATTAKKSATVSTSKPLPPLVIQRRDSFYDDFDEDIQPIQSSTSKVPTVSKSSIQRKDSFDDDSDIIFIEQPPQKLPTTKKVNPPSSSKPFVQSNIQKLKSIPSKNNPALSDNSNIQVEVSPLKMPKGGFSFEE
uniref:Calmodulin-lysine N-methyltransferase n=1 Tax=Panagrolaimus sp. PS1159 TaxID=55785 RepID=A0AC35EXD6_9BILA